MIMIFLVLLMMIRPSSECLARGELVFEDAASGRAERYIYLPSELFSVSAIRGEILENLRALQPYHLAKIVIAADKQDLLYLRRGKAMADYSYDLWAAVFRERIGDRKPLAMALKIGENVAFRYRDAAGISKETSLHGENPFVVHGQHGIARILHVSFSRVPYGTSGLRFTVFFLEHTGALSESAAQSFATSLQRDIFMSEQTLVLVRRDAWFIENEEFPIFYPFGQVDRSPTLHEYVCTPTFICSGGSGNRCRLQDHILGECR
jgi:hypothetical protein